MFLIRFAVLATAAVALVGCAPAARPSPPSNPATKAAPASSPRAASSPAASPGAAGTAGAGALLTLGGFTYADYGTREIRRKKEQPVDAGDYYFKGTFLRGDPGQLLKLEIKNVSQVLHNFSVREQQIDVDIPVSDQRVEIQVTLPNSGGHRFFCKYHGVHGMNGQLLVGEVQPQALARATD